MKKYYRMQVKLDYVKDARLISFFLRSDNKQEALRQLFYYSSAYGNDEKIIEYIKKEKKDND